MKKEDWIGDVLQTAKQVGPVSVNPYLATRIEAKLQDSPLMTRVPLRSVYTAAAAMLILLSMNIFIWRRLSHSPHTSGVQQVIQEYGWASDDIYFANLLNRSHE